MYEECSKIGMEGDKESTGMGLKAIFLRWIEDARTVWRSQGATRPFTRRGVTEADLLEGYKHSRDNAEAGEKPTDPRRSGEKHDRE